jgi:hypothetical protein
MGLEAANDFELPDGRDRLVHPGRRAERTVQAGIGPVDAASPKPRMAHRIAYRGSREFSIQWVNHRVQKAYST